MKFFEGQKLKAVYGPIAVDGTWWGADVEHPTEDHNAKSIEVVMENSQMGPVPWALCQMTDGRTVKLNLALMELVTLLGKQNDEEIQE